MVARPGCTEDVSAVLKLANQLGVPVIPFGAGTGVMGATVPALGGIVLGAAYLLWLFQRTMLGPITNPKNELLKDLNLRELCVMLPLIAWCFWIGLYPKQHFAILEKPVAKIVQRVHPDYYSRNGIPNPLDENSTLAALVKE